ncbi:MAG: hypothetical protein COV75_03625 [Candidatus Omnitrophica bacterium CG11_big_fil_rev_8_21_14_0_20_63_9]|nr:MAG: hypothetical protein COV75_03625 [Candidatus Omnitrophica bacterium CG11_big_fil_rev_8_21_14_0_20_63_9]
MLCVYFLSITLLILGGVSLQRTSMEVRAAQISRDVHQAFWLAEAGLDDALRDFQQDLQVVNEGTFGPFTQSLENGRTSSYSYTVARDVDDPTLIRVTGSGAIGQTVQWLNATVRLGDAFREGLYSAENVNLWYESNNAPNNYMPITGPVHIARGSVGSLVLGNTTIDGSVSIGQPASTTRPWAAHGSYHTSTRPFPSYDDPAAMGFQASYSQGGCCDPQYGSGIQTYMRIPGPPHERTSYDGNPFTTAPTASALRFPQRRDLAPYDAMITPQTIDQRCRGYSTAANVTNGVLRVEDDDEVTITDGHSLDLTGPGDGRILLCQRSISLTDESRLTFTAPTTIYLIDNQGRTDGYVTGIVYYQSERAQMRAVAGDRELKNGVELIIPDWASRVEKDPDRNAARDRSPAAIYISGVSSFPGSIWAPTSKVQMTISQKPRRGETRTTPTRIVAGWIVVLSDLRPAPALTFRAEDGDGAPYVLPDAVSILSWTR